MSASLTSTEIASQPDCWLRAVDTAGAARALLPQRGERVAVIGCGTSWFMAQSYAALREQAGHGVTDAFAASAYPLGRAYDRADRYKEAFAAYDRAAKAGSVSALNNLAALYENGQGVKRQQAEAFRLYRQAGEGGNVVALANAARMLEYGNGIPKDEAQAVALYRRAVSRGDVASISKLVPHYATGAYGFPKDLRQGFDLFRQAADRGDPVLSF